MTFLPIVQRELRVAARRRGTFRARIAMAITAVLVGGAILFLSVAAPPQKAGLFVFQVLTVLALVYCLLAGRQMTADCLSEEKREGTLGLLFLTDLKGHDVVLGKLAATSLPGFYGLLAIFPIMAVPLLMGGVGNGEFWRVVLVLVVTFLFSLSLGLFVSSICRDGRRALGINLVLLLLVGGGPAAVAAIMAALTSRFPNMWLFVSCPPYSLYSCFDVHYKVNPALFWASVAVLHGLSWLMLALASWIAPHSWQERSRQHAGPGFRARVRDWLRGDLSRRRRYRERLLRINAFYWLASRVRRRPDQVWIFLGLMGGWWIAGWFTGGAYWMNEASFIVAALLVNSTLKIWFAIMAGQQLAEERKNGTWEFLLSTPLSVQEIVRGQWLALRRQFAAPVVLVVGLHFLFAALPFQRRPDEFTGALYVAGAGMLVADLIALGWLGMWQALVARNHPRATYATIVRILALPWMLMGIIIATTIVFRALLLGRPEPTSANTNFYLWLVLGLGTDLGFAWHARRKLRTGLRDAALEQFGVAPASPTALAHSDMPVRRVQHSAPAAIATPATPARQSAENRVSVESPRRRPGSRRRVVLGTASLVVLMLLGLWLYRKTRPSYPPPHLAIIGPPVRPLLASPTQWGAIILPGDGTIWHWGGDPQTPGKTFASQVGTNSIWAKLRRSGTRAVGVTLDGQLEEMSMQRNPWDPSVQQANWTSAPVVLDYEQSMIATWKQASDAPWKDVTGYAEYTVALRADGTLWQHGDSLGRSYQKAVTGNPLRFSQVGSDTNWVAVTASLQSVLALRRDGTLWVWGRIYDPWGGATVFTDETMPIRVCRNTNWLAFVSGWPSMILTTTGELWEMRGTPPQPDGPATATCRLLATNATPGRIATGYGSGRTLFQLRADNTLWARNIPLPGQSGGSPSSWQRLGKRSDWTSLYGVGPMTFGMTADGTLWTWGLDPTRAMRPEFSLALVQARVSAMFGGSAANVGAGFVPKFELEPRPIIRFTTNAAAGAPQPK